MDVGTGIVSCGWEVGWVGEEAGKGRSGRCRVVVRGVDVVRVVWLRNGVGVAYGWGRYSIVGWGRRGG